MYRWSGSELSESSSGRGGEDRRKRRLADAGLITVAEFAQLACLSRRQIDRLRKRRPEGFPREFELGGATSKHRRCPRFKFLEVNRWLESRALW